jgi:hypothetical protein
MRSRGPTSRFSDVLGSPKNGTSHTTVYTTHGTEFGWLQRGL